MISSFVPSFLKPVTAMCGLGSYTKKDDIQVSIDEPISGNLKVPAEKPMTRCISQTSASVSTDDSSSSRHESVSDEEVCARMAQLGRAARKAGRHVLRGNKLVLS
jgi:hypothetical protein